MTMPKDDTIAAIMKLNPSVDGDFLAEFSDKQLAEYLGRLVDTTGSPNAISFAGHSTTSTPVAPAASPAGA